MTILIHSSELCKYCGSRELVYDSHVNDSICQDCGFWQDETYPKVRYQGHLWYVGYMLGSTRVQLTRVGWRSQLKRKGIVARTMIAPLIDMPKRIRDIFR